MDKVRLGRALGYGTRHAAKTLAAVVEAAAAPDPQPRSSAGPANQAQTRRPAPAGEARSRVPSSGRSLWAPLATFSSALWLRVTGLFFALIAVAMVGGAWRLRGAVGQTHATPAVAAGALHHLWVFVGLAALFGYFAVSSFVRATRRERRRPV